MKRALMIVLALILIAAVVMGAILLYKNAKASSVPDEHKTPLPQEDPLSYTAEVGGETVEVMFGATAQLQSMLMSLFVPHSFAFEYGSVDIVIDSPMLEAGMLFLAIAIAVALIWRMKR